MDNLKSVNNGIALLRVSLGAMFIAHGLLKVLVFTPAGTVGFFQSVGYPGELAYIVMAAEIFGGALLLTGAYTRLLAVSLLPILVGASLIHLPNGWVFSAEGGGWEYPVFLIAALTAQALMGPGAFALKTPRLPYLPAALAS
jgi:putative oxidoreductase